MKTTLEIPDDLFRDLKLRAVHENKKLKEVVADVINAGLNRLSLERRSSALRRRVSLPLISCKHPAPLGAELTPEAVAQSLADLESDSARA